MSELIGARLIAIGGAVPGAVVTNADLEKLVATSDEWITQRTGIRQRHVVSEGETTTGLATEAAREAIAFCGIDPTLIDLIICATSTPDNLYPSTACMVQAAIGATRAAAFDLEAACTGVIYSMTIARQFIMTGTYKTVLVIGVDIHSRFLDWEDRSTCVLFGDAAGAMILQATEGENEVLSTYLRADGTGGHLLCIPNTGGGFPHQGVTPPKAMQRFLHMNGRMVYEFAITVVPEAVRTACAQANIRVEDLDFLVSHQANERIIKSAADRLGLPMEKIVSNVANVGNTSAASIPLALADAYSRGQIVGSKTLALVGFGGGLTWGASVIRWTATDVRRQKAPASEEQVEHEQKQQV